MAAMDSVNSTGFCGNRTLNNTQLNIPLRHSSCSVTFYQSSRMCFLTATGGINGTSVSVNETSMIQAFYGVGLYTVRGGVNATYNNGFLSGCDYNSNSKGCYVPAFIASSGNIILNGYTPQYCPSSQAAEGYSGIYGEPPKFTNAPFTDLTPLFFNVNCFGSNFSADSSSGGCNYGLTDALVTTYALPYTSSNGNTSSDFTFDQYGQPIINQNLLNDLRNFSNDLQSGIVPNELNNIQTSSCGCINPSSPINLSSLSSSCPNINFSSCPNGIYIYLNNGNSYTITNTYSQSIPLYIYAYNSSLNLNPVSGSVLGQNSYGENTYNLNIYDIIYPPNANSSNNDIINISGGLSNARILTATEIQDNDSNPISNSTIIQALDNSNQNNSSSISPEYFTNNNNNGNNIYIQNSKIITKGIIFPFGNGNIYAYGDLAYLYADACSNPNKCSRSSSNPYTNPCPNNNIYRCGWYVNNAYFGIDQNGNLQDSSGNSLTSLLINNNSIVFANSNNFGGIYFGQDVTYIRSYYATLEGFLVRNFPPNLSLNINFIPSTYFQFNLNAINSLTYNPNTGTGFWFVRPVSCLREPPTPAYMSIITRMTTW